MPLCFSNKFPFSSKCFLRTIWLFPLHHLVVWSNSTHPLVNAASCASFSFMIPTRVCCLQLQAFEYLQTAIILQLKLVKSQNVLAVITTCLILDRNLEWLIQGILCLYITSHGQVFFHLHYSKWSVFLCSGLPHQVKVEGSDKELPCYICKVCFNLPHTL